MSNNRIGRARATPSGNPSDASSSGTPPPAAAGRSGAGQPNAPARSEALNRLPGRRAATASSASERRARTATLPGQRTVAPSEQAQIAGFAAAVDAAQRHGRQWFARTATDTPIDDRTTLALAGEVVPHLHNGLSALDSARSLNCEPPEGYETVKAQLNRYLLLAAKSAVLALFNQVQQWTITGVDIGSVPVSSDERSEGNVPARRNTAGPSHAQASSPQPASQVLPNEPELRTVSDARTILAGYEQIVDAHRARLAEAGPHDPMHDLARLSKQVAQAVTRDLNQLSVELHLERFESLLPLDAVMERMNARSIHAIGDNPAVQAAFDVIDQAHEVDAKQLSNAKVVASAHLDGVDALSEQLCVEAAARIDANDDSPLWRCALDAAAALQTYGSFLRQVSDEARPGVAASASASASGTPADAAAAQRTPETEQAPGASSSASGREREAAATPRQRTRAPATATAVSHAAAEFGAMRIQPAPAQEPDTAQAPRIRYRDLARSVDGDVIAIARALGKDSSTLEQLRDPSFDPIESAQYARNAVQSWLGDIDNVRKTLRRATTGASANPARADQLTDRLDALTTIHQHIAAVESDALKAVPCPKAKHVKRLLQLNQVEHVGAPVRLPSAGDVGDRGTLFEMAIQPKPLASGDAARPLFVHLHTAELMDPSTARTVPFRKLTAVHVKTEAHRRLGARWEQMANALGSVHRGKIDAALLGQLRALARTA